MQEAAADNECELHWRGADGSCSNIPVSNQSCFEVRATCLGRKREEEEEAIEREGFTRKVYSLFNY